MVNYATRSKVCHYNKWNNKKSSMFDECYDLDENMLDKSRQFVICNET